MPFDPYFTARKVRVSNPEANRQWDELMKMDYADQLKIIDAIWAKPFEERTPVEIRLKRRWGIRKVQWGNKDHRTTEKNLHSGESGIRIYRGFNTAS